MCRLVTGRRYLCVCLERVKSQTWRCSLTFTLKYRNNVIIWASYLRLSHVFTCLRHSQCPVAVLARQQLCLQQAGPALQQPSRNVWHFTGPNKTGDVTKRTGGHMKVKGKAVLRCSVSCLKTRWKSAVLHPMLCNVRKSTAFRKVHTICPSVQLVRATCRW
jgi:hypothetical protein